MYKLHLLDGTDYNITYDQSILIAKCIMFLPEWKKVKIADIIFSTRDIDFKKSKRRLQAQQPLIDIDSIEVKEKKSRKSIDF